MNAYEFPVVSMLPPPDTSSGRDAAPAGPAQAAHGDENPSSIAAGPVLNPAPWEMYWWDDVEDE